jgi:serine carboxypeptidase-like clade 2
LQEIGPFYLEEGISYKAGDNLTANPYSWHKLSHLLFIESPAGVGYSINNDPNFEYTDHSTASDNMAALLSFFAGFPELADSPFWIAGESYAGKYIPDLALLIDYYNNGGQGKRVNLKGILVGNGVMSFENGELERSSVDYMVDHEFIDPDLMPYYRGSCLLDAESAGCRYFKTRYNENVDEINPYNVYSYCFYNDSFAAEEDQPQQKSFAQTQGSILRNLARNKGKYSEEAGNNGAPCAYFDGLYDYFNAHVKEFKATAGMTWNGPCVSASRFRRTTSRPSTT